MEPGDAKAWDHAISHMDMLNDGERETLALAICYTTEKVDGHADGTSEKDIKALFAWAEGVRIDGGLLDSILKGDMHVRMGADGEPVFSLSPKGHASAKEIARSVGLPVPDENAA